MKKTFKLLAIILACMMLTSCSSEVVTTADTTTVATSATVVPPLTHEGTEPPREPGKVFGAKDFETLKMYIETGECDNYPLVASAYECYYNDGYIYYPYRDGLQNPGSIRLVTRSYDIDMYDIGTWQIFDYTEGDEYIAVGVFHADKTVLAETGGDILKYIEMRFEGLTFWEEGDGRDRYIKEVSWEGKTTEAIFVKSQCESWYDFGVYFFIDDTHYFWMQYRCVTEEGLIEFLSGMTFEKVPLDIAE